MPYLTLSSFGEVHYLSCFMDARYQSMRFVAEMFLQLFMFFLSTFELLLSPEAEARDPLINLP